MAFYNNNDIALDNKLDEIKDNMREALDLIKACEDDMNSEISTYSLKRTINRFLDDF